ncbi:hypothetical protein [Ruegeria sp. HKCCA5426]|uniref:hypothetical protein n=1 Tax=Ruegeria sp. HKCCA5426 TaxID=2682985 RepID=UPI001488BD54|nr:hypothetical protein [Ruegeria sp. HKCCA5426]
MKNEASSVASIGVGVSPQSDTANMTTLKALMLVVTFAVMLMLPAAINGFPFVFFDTEGYHKAGEAVVQTIAGKPAEELIAENTGSQAQSANEETTAQPGNSENGGKFAVPMSRSPYYGIFVYVFFGVQPYLLAFFQSLIVGYAAWLTVRQLCPVDPVKPYLAAGAICALATPLPYFSTYTMPDIFAALAPICLFLLCYGRKNLSVLQKVFCWVTLAAAAAFHNSHILVIFGLLTILLFMSIWPRLRPTFSGLLVSCSAFGAGVFAVFLFAYVAFTMFGSWPQSIPFLTARGIEDGPVAELIDNDCEQHGFTICGAAPLQSRDSQHFLWHPDGFFRSSDPDTKLQLSNEDASVFLTAALEYPGMQIAASLKNSAEQFGLFGLYEFETAKRVFLEQAPLFMSEVDLKNYGDSKAVTGAYPFVALSTLIYVVAAFSLMTVFYIYASRPVSDAALALGILILATLVVNAVVCGVLSDPHHRYQARVVWLLPLLATYLVFHINQRRAGS